MILVPVGWIILEGKGGLQSEFREGDSFIVRILLVGLFLDRRL